MYNKKANTYDVDKEELSNIIETHSYLVKKIANHLYHKSISGIALDDLIQAGMIGLLEAYKNFNHDKGASFETYASIRVRGAMIDEIRKNNWAPRSAYRDYKKIYQASAEIEKNLGRSPTEKEIAVHMNISLDKFHEIKHKSKKIFCLEDVQYDGVFCDEMLSVLPGPLDGLQEQNFIDNLAHLIAQLPERERTVIGLYYDEELNLKEVGKILGVSESRISQIHAQVMTKLQMQMKDWNI